MDVYYDFKSSKTSAISVAFEQYSKKEEIQFHKHLFYEFSMIHKGTCTHKFRNVEVPLIPGDLVLIPPHENHGYTVWEGTEITNCYFFPERLKDSSEYITSKAWSQPSDYYLKNDVKNQWDSLLSSISFRNEEIGQEPDLVLDSLTKQGVLHLAPETALDVENLLQRLYAEDVNNQPNNEYMKAALLQMLLVIFQRARYNLPQITPQPPQRKKQLVLQALTYIETHYSESLSIPQLADMSSLSESYFRSVFRDVTGLTPLNYLNRVRMIKALEYLSRDDLPIAEASARVGILDSNYFSRLFKKIIGYPPKYFKKISDKASDL